MLAPVVHVVLKLERLESSVERFRLGNIKKSL